MKSVSESVVCVAFAAALVGSESPAPGWNRCTMARPRVSDTREAKMNQAMALPPTRPTRRGAFHMRDPRDQGGKHQGRDDHFYQAQEDGGDDAEAVRHASELRRGQPLMAGEAHGDATDHGGDKPDCEFAVHCAHGIA